MPCQPPFGLTFFALMLFRRLAGGGARFGRLARARRAGRGAGDDRPAAYQRHAIAWHDRAGDGMTWSCSTPTAWARRACPRARSTRGSRPTASSGPTRRRRSCRHRACFGTGILEGFDKRHLARHQRPRGGRRATSRSTVACRRDVQRRRPSLAFQQRVLLLPRATARGRRTRALRTCGGDWKLPGRPPFIFAEGRTQYDDFQAWQFRAGGFGGVGYALSGEDDVNRGQWARHPERRPDPPRTRRRRRQLRVGHRQRVRPPRPCSASRPATSSPTANASSSSTRCSPTSRTSASPATPAS